jgi:hypothetical protein
MMRDPSVSGKAEKLTLIQVSLMFLPLIARIPYKPWSVSCIVDFG